MASRTSLPSDFPYTREDIQVIALELQDATEDLNDGIREVERLLQGCAPARVPIPPFEKRQFSKPRVVSGHALFWDGQRLIYEDGKVRAPLLTASRAARCRAVWAFWELGRLLGVGP